MAFRALVNQRDGEGNWKLVPHPDHIETVFHAQEQAAEEVVNYGHGGAIVAHGSNEVVLHV